MPLHLWRHTPTEQNAHSEVPLPLKFPPLPTCHASGTAKGRNGDTTEIGPHDVFGRFDPFGHVLTPVATGHHKIGTVLVQDDRKARRRHNIPVDHAVPPSCIFRNVYDTIFDAARGLSRGPVKYDAVEVPVITKVEGAVSQLYTRHLLIDAHDPAQAAAWRERTMRAVNELGMDVQDERKRKALEALVAMSDVNDRSGKVNMERASLVCLMVERLLRERFGDITVKRCRMSKNTAAVVDVLKMLISLTNTMDRVAFQAFNYNPLTGEPGNVIRQDNAARFWREHATSLQQHQIRPFGNWFYAMTVALGRAAQAMDDGKIDVVRNNMQIIQAIAAVAKGRIAVERVLAPVAEMRDLARRKGSEEGAFRSFSESWAANECATVLCEWETEHGPHTAPLSASDTVSAITQNLRIAHTSLLENSITQGYDSLKEAAARLERRIVLPGA